MIDDHNDDHRDPLTPQNWEPPAFVRDSAPRTFLNGRVKLHAGDVLKPHASLAAKRALEIGKAAEYLVVADLILAGYRAFLTDQGLPYDVVIDHGGRLIRIQVKSRSAPMKVPNRPGSSDSYMFGTRRAGKGNKRRIGNDEFDILALVALDIRVIAYLPIGPKVLQSINLRIPECTSSHGNRGRGNINSFPISLAIKELSQ